MARTKKNVAHSLFDSEDLCSFQCPYCSDVLKTSRGRQRHISCKHPELSSDEDAEELGRSTVIEHQYINGKVVNQDGAPLPPHTAPPPPAGHTDNNAWYPFRNRLAFDFAHHNYVEQQSSEAKINAGLDLWKAATIEALESADDCAPLLWSNAQDLYHTIDNIQEGGAPFQTIYLRYNGPVPENNPPAWMTTDYELCVRDARSILHQQLASKEFEGQFHAAPYRQFNNKNDRVYSNLMSGNWAWREADKIAEDPATHGAMLVPVVSGLDKTTVSVATGHQEYHPFYISAGNLSNTARRSHGSGVVPVAFLPIPKVSKRQRKRKEYKTFARQLYHTAISLIFEPLRDNMTKPEIVRCPDGHFRWAVYSIGPVIADYPEQVWLTGIVQNWCPKCFARPENLDDHDASRRTHEKTDFLIKYYDSTSIWDSFGVRDDVVPFTHGFPRADIHELIAPDLLHQVIKGTFKDHIVTWINEYIYAAYPKTQALEIIQDIDHRISAVPSYPGLRRFKDGRDFHQWTGNDSKALMKVYLAAIVGYVPNDMIKCLASFLEVCYIFRRNAITAPALSQAEYHLNKFHQLREIFVETGVREHCSLPRQHALLHFLTGIPEFGAPNGICSSITESRHITAVKEPWRRSSRYEALSQMLKIIVRMDKMASIRAKFSKLGMLQGSTSMYMALTIGNGGQPLEVDEIAHQDETEDGAVVPDDDNREDDVGAIAGPRFASSTELAHTKERNYPKSLKPLAKAIKTPNFKQAFLEYVFQARYPTEIPPDDIQNTIDYTGKIYVHHSATCRFFAPSDACGAGGMQREIIRCNPKWRKHGRLDTIFVSQGDQPGMEGMLVGQLRLLFSFTDPETEVRHECALVNWFPVVDDDTVYDGGRDPLTGMWVVAREEVDCVPPLQVIPLATIVRGAHLLPVFGEGYLPEDFDYQTSLDRFLEFYVNHYVDHHVHELISDNETD